MNISSNLERNFFAISVEDQNSYEYLNGKYILPFYISNQIGTLGFIITQNELRDIYHSYGVIYIYESCYLLKICHS